MGGDRIDRRQDFDQLLSWLDADPEAAEEKYRALRQRLVQVFFHRGALVPEDLADETISRVAERVTAVKDNYQGDPTRYFYGVARNVFRETTRSEAAVPFEETRFSNTASPAPEAPFPEYCFERCLSELSPEQRDLVLRYYQNEKRLKIRNRQELAVTLGIEGRVMRLRVHRIRSRLKDCLLRCMNEPRA